MVPLQCSRPHTSTGTEEMQAKIPGAHFYKSFNTINAMHMEPSEESLMGRVDPLVMLYCGEEEHSALVEEFITGVGWTPKRVGGLRYARNLEV